MCAMPKDSHCLSNSDMHKIMEWFLLHIGERSCAICDHKGWYPANFLITEVIYDAEKNFHRDDLAVPTVMVYCKTCGHASHFNAKRIGLET